MTRKLVTVATFDIPVPAHMALNALQAAGIRAIMADETLVAMDWLLSNAVGGIKIQVSEEDVERAVMVLEQKLGQHNEPQEHEGTEHQDDEHGAFGDQEPVHPDERPTPVSHEDPHETPPPPSERDQYARRALLAGFTGLVVPLVPFYALYLLLNAFFGRGRLSRWGRVHLLYGSIMTAFGIFRDYLLCISLSR